MIYESFNGESEITSDSIWSDWITLNNAPFSAIHEKIRKRRKMYKLEWEPVDSDPSTSKRWRDYVIDPLPRNDIDFKADRLTGRPLMIRIPTEQLDIDTVDVLNQNDGFKGLSPNTDLQALTKKLRETAKDISQRRADSIEKYLNGTLYINQVLRKEHLELRWAMHFLVDGYAGYIVYYDETASDDEYPVILRALDPLRVVYTHGDQKKDKLLIGRQDLVINLRREFGSTMFEGYTDNSLCYVIDYWQRVKTKQISPVDGTTKYVPEVWHATYIGNNGLSGDAYLSGGAITYNGGKNKHADLVGWALKPSKTDYFEIPGDIVEARVTALTEEPENMVASDLDGAEEIWNARNYFLTRTHRLVKLGSGADLITKGISTDLLQHLGKGEGVTAMLPTDSNIQPEQATAWMRPPPADPNNQMLAVELNQMLQQSLMSVTSLGNRGGTVSGAQVDALDQGSSVRLQTYVNAMNLLNTSWARSAMQIASVFYKEPNKKIAVYGIDKNSNPFAGSISAADINGDYTVFVECNPQTLMEELQQALIAIKLTSDDPSEAILSKQTVRENYLKAQYNWQEEQRIKREAEEFNENAIKVAAQRGITQAQMTVLNNLEQIRVQGILRGVPPNPIIMQMMTAMQDSLLKGVAGDMTTDMANQQMGAPPSQGIQPPTNEGMANENQPGPTDARTFPPMSQDQQQNDMQAQMRRNGMQTGPA